MATYIKTLKEDNGDIVYPQTNTDAVYTSGGETLETRISKYVTAEDVAQSVQSFGTVTSGMLDSSAVTTAKIASGAVTTAKLDSGAVTTAKITNGAVTSAKIDFSTFGAGNYSNVETATEFTWIDGKTIYRKTIHIGALPNNGTVDYDSGITNIDYVVDIRGVSYRSADTATAPLPFATPSGTGAILLMYIKSNNKIRVTTGTDRSPFDGYVTVWYTKTS